MAQVSPMKRDGARAQCSPIQPVTRSPKRSGGMAADWAREQGAKDGRRRSVRKANVFAMRATEIFRWAIAAAVKANGNDNLKPWVLKEIAGRLGVSRSTLQHWLTPSDVRQPTWPAVFALLADESVLPAEVRSKAVQLVMHEWGVVGGGAALEGVPTARELMSGTLQAAAATGRVTEAVAVAMHPDSPGGTTVTPSERAAIAGTVMDAERALVGLEAAVAGGKR